MLKLQTQKWQDNEIKIQLIDDTFTHFFIPKKLECKNE